MCPLARTFQKSATDTVCGHGRKRSSRVAQIATPDARPVGAFTQRESRHDANAVISIRRQSVPPVTKDSALKVIPAPVTVWTKANPTPRSVVLETARLRSSALPQLDG